MQTLPPLSDSHIQIAHHDAHRVPSVGTGAYAHPLRSEKQDLSRFSTQEKEIVDEEEDDRDIKKKQVRGHCSTSNQCC